MAMLVHQRVLGNMSSDWAVFSIDHDAWLSYPILGLTWSTKSYTIPTQNGLYNPPLKRLSWRVDHFNYARVNVAIDVENLWFRNMIYIHGGFSISTSVYPGVMTFFLTSHAGAGACTVLWRRATRSSAARQMQKWSFLIDLMTFNMV